MLTYEELLQKYNASLEEINVLRKENIKLKSMLGIEDTGHISVMENVSGGINKYSSPEEKIGLFRSLFKGREDVFARRWQSRTSGKSGYQPVCENEWADGICDSR